MTQYPEMFDGWCLLLIMYFIVCLQSNYPGEQTSGAYRWISHSAHAAIQSILILAGIAYLALRLAFGGSPNPVGFCAFSEAHPTGHQGSYSDHQPEGLFYRQHHCCLPEHQRKSQEVSTHRTFGSPCSQQAACRPQDGTKFHNNPFLPPIKWSLKVPRRKP